MVGWFYLASRNRQYSQYQALFSNPLRQFFLWPWVVFSHTCGDQYSREWLRETFCRFWIFSVCSSLFSGTPFYGLYSPCSFYSQFFLLNSRTLLGSAWVSHLCCGLHTLKALVEGIHWSHLIYFLSLRDPSFLAWCSVSYKPMSVFLFVCWKERVVSGRRVNSVPVTPSWLKAEVSKPLKLSLILVVLKRGNYSYFCSLEKCIIYSWILNK